MSLPASSYSLLFLHVDIYNHNRPSVRLYLFLLFCFLWHSTSLFQPRFQKFKLQLFRAQNSLFILIVRDICVRTFPNPCSLNIRISPFPKPLRCMSQSFKLSVCGSWIAVVFKQFPLFLSLSRHQSSFIFFLFTCTSLSHQQLLFLYSFTHYPIWCIADYSCVHREVCVIGKAGKGTSIEKGRCFWSCIVLRVASDREYPTHTTFICFSASYACRLPFRSAFVWTSRPSIAVVVAKAGCGCCLVHGKELPI